MTGQYRVLSGKDSARWLDFLQRVQNPDLHFTPGYLQIFQEEGDARLFVFERDAQTIVYPFVLRKVNGLPGIPGDQLLYDITSPYGYGGPLYTAGTDKKIFNEFYACFQQFCREHQIITEFIRFHPLLENHALMTDLVEVERNSTIVFVDLARPLDEIWSGYQRCNRKNINKARREGVTVVIEQSPRHFAEFAAIYRQTMDRNNAGAFYYFSPEFFRRVHHYLKNHYVYAHALVNGRIAATELLIYNRYYMHSFLGGTLADFFIYRPNNLLKHEVIYWAKQQGIKYFVLGGGRSDDDGIFRYKSTFSGDVKGYYIGKKIHDREAVTKLTGCPAQVNEKGGFFPPYRR